MEGHQCCSPGHGCNWYQVQDNAKNKLLSEEEKESRKHPDYEDSVLIKTFVIYDSAIINGQKTECLFFSWWISPSVITP